MRKYKNAQTMLRRYEFSNLFSKGKYYCRKYIYAFFMPNNQKLNKVGFMASKKNGNAVTRNKVKRYLRQAFVNNIDKLGTNKIIAFGIKSDIEIKNISFKQINDDMEELLDKIIK